MDFLSQLLAQPLDWRGLLLPAMVPLFLAALLAEVARFRGQGRFLFGDSCASIGLGVW